MLRGRLVEMGMVVTGLMGCRRSDGGNPHIEKERGDLLKHNCVRVGLRSRIRTRKELDAGHCR